MGHGRKIRTHEYKGEKSLSRFAIDVIGKSFDLELVKDGVKDFTVKINGKDYKAVIEDILGDSIWISVDGSLYFVDLLGEPNISKLDILVNERKRNVKSADLFGSEKITLSKKSKNLSNQDKTFADPVDPRKNIHGLAEGILAPMPGKVVMVTINVGDDVKAGDVVVILEAMKMENEITSQKDGRITEIRVKEGDSVDAHDVLVVVD
jgi:biotin carboxyl carrier protein